MLRALSANRGPAIVAFSAAVFSAVFQTAVPALTGRAIDIAAGNTAGDIHKVAWAMVAIALATFAVNFIRRFTSGRLASNSQHWMRVQLLRTLHRLDGPGQDRIVAGQVVSRSITDLGQFHMVLGSSPMLFTRALQLVATLVVMFAMDVSLSLMALALLPLMIWEANRSRRLLYAATWVNQQKAADLTQQVEETVSGVRVVQAFGQEQREIDALDALGKELYAVKMRTAKLTARFQPLLAQLPKVALVITIVIGGMSALRGDITVGTFVAFTAYLTAMTTQLSALTSQYVRIHMGMSSVARLEDVLELAPEAPEAPETPATQQTQASSGIRFDHVDFALNGNQVLDDFTLHVNPGEQVAIVGPPGSGKTMALQLGGGFYTPDHGTVFPTDRTKVTCVFDEAFLFSTSVYDNIALGNPEASQAEVEQAARLALADEFIERLPEGYQTEVGERGLTLSGGQRQRIALARALLARPKVLLLDDATSAIDAINEAKILANLRSHLHGVTVIAVAHRQSTVDHADRVIVMDHGHVIMDGPRDKVVHTEAYQALMGAGGDHVGVDKQKPSAETLWPEVAQDAAPASATEELMERVAQLPEATEMPQLQLPEGEFRVRNLFSAVRWLIVATVALLVVGVAADLAFPTLTRAAIDGGIEQGNREFLLQVGALGLGVVLIAWAAEVAMTVLSSRAGERLLYGLRLRSYAHLQRLGLSYFESRLSGKIITRMTTDIDTLSSFLQTGLAQAIVAVGSLIGVSVMLVSTDGALTLIAMLAVPVIVLATLVFRHYSKRFYRAARTQVSLVNGQFAELIGGIRVTQMHRGEARAEAAFAAESDHYRRLRMRSITAMGLYFPAMQAISQIMTALVIGIGAQRVADGTLSIGVLVAFTMYLGQLYGPIQQLGQIFDSWQQATVSFERITQLLRERTDVPDTGTSPDARQAVRGELLLADATFTYQSATTPTIANMTLALRPGENVALVGPTGAGKSTVVKLLARFYDPVEGSVRASGVDIREFPLPQWRRSLAQVPQESYLFAGTVASNIAYGMPQATDADIEAAVERIGALDVIASIPGGFNARVGDRGRRLSSGQRQIIALARAELLQPDAMLLDEATATLDPATERAVLNASSQATVGRTAVIVAHRLATAARADRIVFIDSGRIVEDGSHAELLAMGGRYARMWEAHR
ncbi:ABC transporter ATP-binding protein [Corynebacterium sp. HMSC30G07]|uniref:ABC transporter ATP-binding protein n=1 Tax=Corynebacterium sp. HMSC30G07 TaxID=1581072 RepID=UPI00352C2FE3